MGVDSGCKPRETEKSVSRLRNIAAAQLRSTDAGTRLGLQTLSFSKEAAQQSILFTSAVNCKGWAQQAVDYHVSRLSLGTANGRRW